jgi:hypothetical protein
MTLPLLLFNKITIKHRKKPLLHIELESASVYSADFTAAEENPAKTLVLQEKSYLSEYSQDFGAASPTHSRLEGGSSFIEGSKKNKTTASGENSRYQDDDFVQEQKSNYTASSGQFHKDSASYAEDKYEDDYTPLNSITKLEQTQEQPEQFPMSNINHINNLPDSPVIHARAGSLLGNPSVDYGDEGFDFENKSSLSLKLLSKNDPINELEEEERQAQSSQKSVKATKTETPDDDAVDPDLSTMTQKKHKQKQVRRKTKKTFLQSLNYTNCSKRKTPPLYCKCRP